METNPDKLAIKYPFMVDGAIEYKELSFGEFKTESLKWANGIQHNGFKRGDRIILLFPVSMELYQIIFACFYLGITPVFIDLSMGTKKLIQSIKASKAKAIFSIDKLLKFKYFVPAMWGKKCFSLDRKRWLIDNLNKLFEFNPYSFSEIQEDPSSSALITFTSGSTGSPKGANRTIEVLLNQKIVSEFMWPHHEDEMDMPAFPMIVLQNLGCGISSILPYLNFQNHLEMNPAIVVDQLIKEKVTRLSAQPYFIEQISDYLLKNNKAIPDLRSLVVGGACVSKSLCKNVIAAFPDAEANIVYGSTEAEPIATTPMQEFVDRNGRGLLLGTPVESIEVKILKVSDHPDINQDVLNEGIGEIILAGPHVIKEYIDHHPANLELKLKDKSGVVWHRTGDMGYFDADQKLWLVGRVKDCIESALGLIPCYDLEEELLEFKNVLKAAFVNHPHVLAIETESEIDKSEIKKYLDEKGLTNYQIKVFKKLPVDQRHFSRVDRQNLKQLLLN